jgi:hypothetical protein
MSSRGRIIVSGILFWYPLAGVTYQCLHYLEGLKRLGYDVLYIEDSGRWVYDPGINELSPDAAGNINRVLPTLKSLGFDGRWAFRGRYPGGQCLGMTAAEIDAAYRDADGFLNLCGAQEIHPEHLRIPRRVYVETDPVASQIRVAKGDPVILAQLDAHHVHFTFGENLGNPDCRVPIVKYHWKPTRQPVIMDFWSHSLPAGAAYTTIATWHNAGKDIEFNGETYHWSKDREFEKFITLPRAVRAPMELAMGNEPEPVNYIQSNGWRWRDSVALSSNLEDYRRYIQSSRGEFTVAKDQNIRLRSGWFSDRSACYLAAGRPVITQETGFSNILPVGRGLFGFSTRDDILAAMDRIDSDYPAACLAARDIAREYFSAELVLEKLMEEAGL